MVERRSIKAISVSLLSTLSELPWAPTIAGRPIQATARKTKIEIACNIRLLTELCQYFGFRDKLTDAAGYLPNDRRPISFDQLWSRVKTYFKISAIFATSAASSLIRQPTIVSTSSPLNESTSSLDLISLGSSLSLSCSHFQ
jgi:hypothetical protein